MWGARGGGGGSTSGLSGASAAGSHRPSARQAAPAPAGRRRAPVLGREGWGPRAGGWDARRPPPRLGFPRGKSLPGEAQARGSPGPSGRASRDPGWGGGDRTRAAGGAIGQEQEGPLPRNRPRRSRVPAPHWRGPGARNPGGRPPPQPAAPAPREGRARRRAARPGGLHTNEGRGAGRGLGRGGAAPARAGTHRGGRGDCEVALTHVPGFLSGQGGDGGGARAGLGWRR